MSAQAFAEVKSGAYLGLSVGESSFDIDKSDLDDLVLDAFFSQGATVLTGTSSLDDGDTSMSLVLGYRFNPYIAIEGTYLDLGAAEYRSNGTVNPPGPVTSAPASVGIDVESKGFTIAGVGSIPIGSTFELHGRLGLFIAETELSVAATIQSSTGRESDSFDSTGVFYGLGAGLNLGDHWTFSLDWTLYSDVGDEGDDEDESAGGIDIDALSLSVAYRF